MTIVHETTNFPQLIAFVSNRTEDAQIIANFREFALMVLSIAIENTPGFEEKHKDRIKARHTLTSGKFEWAAHMGHVVPGYRYDIVVKIFDEHEFTGHAYLLLGDGGKIINFLLEDDVINWAQDS